MYRMSEFDHLDLDGRVAQAVSRRDRARLGDGGGADELGVTQSAVSHALHKLRAIVRDPLFVKSGRGIVATAMPRRWRSEARALLAHEGLFARRALRPAQARLSLTIAANDLQRDLMLPALPAGAGEGGRVGVRCA